jgi:hypothetical protein
MQQVQTLRVLNKKQLRGVVPHAVYIGRPSVWGNPFVIGKDGTRAEVVEKYERSLLRQPHLMAQLGKLRGCNLICWCAPLQCHGDVLLRLANGPGLHCE